MNPEILLFGLLLTFFGLWSIIAAVLKEWGLPQHGLMGFLFTFGLAAFVYGLWLPNPPEEPEQEEAPRAKAKRTRGKESESASLPGDEL